MSLFKTYSRTQKQDEILAAVKAASEGRLIVDSTHGEKKPGTTTVGELAKHFRTTVGEVHDLIENTVGWGQNPEAPVPIFALTKREQGLPGLILDRPATVVANIAYRYRPAAT